jgi:hypothetical protein
MSIGAVASTPPTPLPAASTSTEVLANNAAFQQSLLQAPSSVAQTGVLGNDPNQAFQASLVDSTLSGLSSTSSPSSNDGFQSYLTETYLGVSATPAPNPFGTTLAGLELGSLAYAAPAQPDPFAQLGIGINVSALQ